MANLGNFVNRVLSFMKKYELKLPEICQGLGLKKGPTPLNEIDEKSYQEDFAFDKENGSDEDFEKLVNHFVKDVNTHLLNYTKEMEAVRLRPGLNSAMALSARGNLFLVQAGLDNSLFENHRNRCDAVMLLAVNLIWVLSAEFFPFMPETSDQICKQLRAPPRSLPEGVPDIPIDSKDQPQPVAVDETSKATGIRIENQINASSSPAPSSKAVLPPKFSIDLLPGHTVGKASHLFKPIDEKMEEVWRKQFGGDSSTKEKEEEKPQLSKNQQLKAAKAAKKKAEAEAGGSSAAGDSKKKKELKEEEKSEELKGLESKMKSLADQVRKGKEEIKRKEKEEGTDLELLDSLKVKSQSEIDQLVGYK